MNTFEARALAHQYGAASFRIFPIAIAWDGAKGKTNKRPLTDHGFVDSTSDAATIDAQFDEAARRLGKDEVIGVGLHLGPSGLVAIDVDVANGKTGDEVIRDLEQQHHDIEGLRTTSASGGYHIILRTETPISNKVCKDWQDKGVDVRGALGYIVAPGTRTPWGSWEWDGPGLLDDIDVPSVPDFLAEYLTPVGESKSTSYRKLTDEDREQLDPATLAALDLLTEHHGAHNPILKFEKGRAPWVELTRPGKEHGTSASIGNIAPGRVKFFSTDWSPFNGGSRYSAEELEAAAAQGRDPRDDQEVWNDHVAAQNATAVRPAPAAPLTVASRPVMRPEAFHGIAGRIVEELAPTTEADPAALLAVLLTQVGSVIGAGPHIPVGAVNHPARLFTAVVGRTARARKDTAEREVRRIVSAADPGWVDRVVGGFGSGESVVDIVRDPDPNDENDRGRSDDRLLIRESELARVFRVASRDGSTLSQIIRQAWDGDRLEARTRARTVTATGAHISISAGITAEELRRELSGVEIANGFGNRFLYIWAERARRLADGGGLADGRVRALADDLARVIADFRRFFRFFRSREGDERWAEVYERLADEGDELEGIVGALTARAEPMTLRLSLLYAGLDGTKEIGPEHIDAGLAVWDYSQDTVKHIYGGLTGDPVADRLLEAIRRSGENGLTATEQSQALSGHAKKEALERARKFLEDTNRIETKEIKTAGRPRTVSVAKEAKKAKEEGGA